jgi:RNA polymerase sigma-70 factor (ECF subfamily)
VLDPDEARRFRAGDPEAVRAMYRAYGRLVFAVAYRVLGDTGLAEEATQQAFVQAWRAAGDYDLTREPGPWLAVIARRAAIDIHRREVRQSNESLDVLAERHPSLVTLPPSVESVSEMWEVRRAVAGLSADEQQIIRLQHFSGLTHAEIAERIGVPIGTVKSRSFRAHRRLAGRLEHLREGRGQADLAPAEPGGGRWTDDRRR